MIKLKKDKVLQAAEAISVILHEDIFGCETEGYTVGDYQITADGLLLRKDDYTNDVMNEALADFEPTPITDRKETVKLLEAHTGKTAVYLKAPTYAYRIGDYIVDRDGNVTKEQTTVEVTIPRTHITAEGLKNLIYMIAAKGELISKATGGEFKVDRELIEDLAVAQIYEVESIMRVVERSTGELKGLKIESDHLTFTGFPQNENTQAYIHLASLMVQTAEGHKRISAKPAATDNEKFTFRVFLISLGMKGDTYKEARKVLLKNLDGNGAFRTQAQADKHKEKMNELSKQRNN